MRFKKKGKGKQQEERLRSEAVLLESRGKIQWQEEHVKKLTKYQISRNTQDNTQTKM